MLFWIVKKIAVLVVFALSVVLLATAQSHPPVPRPGKSSGTKQEETDAKKENIDRADQQTEPVTPITKQLPNQQNSGAETSGHEGRKSETLSQSLLEPITAIFTVVLAIATIVLVRVGVLQRRTMEEHKKTFEMIAISLKDGLAETRKAADAAVLNAKALIASERPWLLVSIQNKPGGFVLQARNAGRTPAEPIEGHCVSRFEVVSFRPSEDPITPPQQKLLVSADSFPMRDLGLIPVPPDEGDANLKMFCVYGWVTYWDAFADRNAVGAKPYRTSWHFWYDPARGFYRAAGDYAQNK